jgi:hypothetical protein
MDKYYYVIGQLPVLSFDKLSPMTMERFLDEAKKWLPHGEYTLLSNVKFNDTYLHKRGPRTWNTYRRFEHDFRKDIASWRQAQRKGVEYKPASFSLALIEEGNPLEIEKKLLKWRWNFIDSLEKDHHFDIDYLILYFLKLQILNRLSLFDREKGLERFRNLVSSVLKT